MTSFCLPGTVNISINLSMGYMIILAQYQSLWYLFLFSLKISGFFVLQAKVISCSVDKFTGGGKYLVNT